MVSNPSFRHALFITVLLMLTLPMSAATHVAKGLDFFYTPKYTANITVNIPAGLFCGGTSPAIGSKTFDLKGNPLLSYPAGVVSPTDTVLDRTQDAVFPLVPDPNKLNPVTIPVIIRALSMKSTNFLIITCPGGITESWQALVGLTKHGDQVPGSMTLYHQWANGGTFSASFPVIGQVKFRNQATNALVGSLSRNDQVTTANACWGHTPPAGVKTWSGLIGFDSNLDFALTNVVDDYLSNYGTSNFFPGACPSGYVPTTHTGPHPQTCLPGIPSRYCPVRIGGTMCEEDQLAVLESLRTDTGFALDPDAHALGEARVFGELDLQGQPETIVSTAVGSISVSEAEICLATVGYFLNGD